MKLMRKVNVAGYQGSLPIYLVDKLEEQVGGDNPCPFYIGLAALDATHKVEGTSPTIIVVSEKFLKFSRKNKLALLAYYSALPEQENYDFSTSRGAELSAKTEVVAIYGKMRFKRAFRKIDNKERNEIAKAAGKVHAKYKVLKKEESKLEKELDGMGFDTIDVPPSEDPIDIAEAFRNRGEDVEIRSYKGAVITPIDAGISRSELDNNTSETVEVYEGDIIDENDDVPTPEPAGA